jgi:hypothetical protein
LQRLNPPVWVENSTTVLESHQGKIAIVRQTIAILPFDIIELLAITAVRNGGSLFGCIYAENHWRREAE